MDTVWIVALAVAVLNLPFGYWRESLRRFSLAWFIAVPAPIPAVIGLRILSGLGWKPISFPIILAAYFLGQFLGGLARRRFGSLGRLIGS